MFEVMVVGLAMAAAPEEKAQAFIADHLKRIKPMEKTVALAWWNANTTGRDEDFKTKVEAQNRLDAELTDKNRFAQLKAIKESEITDPLLRRQIEILYLGYLEKQVDADLLRKMTEKANAIEQAFNVYRAKVGGEELADSKVREILKKSKDSAQRQAVWEASKGVGANVEGNLRELVALRNAAAKKLGFRDYHVMMLSLNEQSQEAVLGLFDELDELTRGPFLSAKAEIDAKLSADYKLPVEGLRPWHYHDPFFQEPPAIYRVNLDDTYAKVDILQLCKDFYAGIGLPIDDVLKRSSLYEQPGKSPHAFCTDIDREGDVRVLANIVPNDYWMGTMLHELGHAVYSSKNIPASMPYVLRSEAHILTTEGVAMMFERFAKSADWLERMGVKVADPKGFNETGAKMRRNQLLIFSRWCQVMLRFEKELYAHPEQDLNKLWWDLVEKYQNLKRPEGRNQPDYASKIHIVSAPAYYHNYMMGELFACQVYHALVRDVLGGGDPEKADVVGKPAVGKFMKERCFGPGKSLPWNELTKHITGEHLNAKAFAKDFSQ